MLIPAVIYFLVFNYAPMFGMVLAFKRYNYTQGIIGSPWVGWDNFRFLFSSGVIWRITKNTVLYNIVFISVGLVLQVGVAILLNEVSKKWYKSFTQSMMFLPYFVSYVLLSAFIYNVFNYEYGMLNNVLQHFGFERFDVYGSTKIWKYLLVFFHEWKGLGYGVVIYLAAITGISGEFYEAARVDGATKWQQIKLITLPLLKPTIVIVTLFAVGRIMRGQFELFYQIIGNNGMLFKSTDIIDTYVFRAITLTFDPGMGIAAGLYQSATGFILIVAVNEIVKKIEPDYALF